MQLNSKLFGLAGGIIFGLIMLLCTFLSILTGYGTAFLNFMTSIYPGYSITWHGAFIGLAYGFIDCFVGLWIFALLYNWLQKKMRNKEKIPD